MAVSCDDLFELATQLAAAEKSESDRRAAVSRAYYAVYHCAIRFHERLPSQGLPPSRGGTHVQLSHALSNPTVRDKELRTMSRRIGYLCQDLHGKRVIADYRLHENVSSQDVEQAIAQARQVFKLAESTDDSSH